VAGARTLSDSEGNLFDDVSSERQLDSFEDFVAAVANDFIEPSAAIHRDKKGSSGEAIWTAVLCDLGVDDIGPQLKDLRFMPTLIEPHGFHNPGHKLSHIFRRSFPSFFLRRNVLALPFAKGSVASRGRQSSAFLG
jgi:hypothetical protein